MSDRAIVLALRAWGLKWGGLDPADEPAVKLIHTACGGKVGSTPICGHCGEPLYPRAITAMVSDAFTAEREARRVVRFGETRPPTGTGRAGLTGGVRHPRSILDGFVGVASSP